MPATKPPPLDPAAFGLPGGRILTSRETLAPGDIYGNAATGQFQPIHEGTIGWTVAAAESASINRVIFIRPQPAVPQPVGGKSLAPQARLQSGDIHCNMITGACFSLPTLAIGFTVARAKTFVWPNDIFIRPIPASPESPRRSSESEGGQAVPTPAPASSPFERLTPADILLLRETIDLRIKALRNSILLNYCAEADIKRLTATTEALKTLRSKLES